MYSIEEICEAMTTAGSAAAYCRSEQEYLLCAMQAGGDLLEVSCSMFYADPSPATSHIGTVRVNQGGGSELEIPEILPAEFRDHIRRQPGHMLISSQWDALGTMLPALDFDLSSSIWISVGDDERHFGTLALFDHSSRRFDRTQQKIVQLFARMLALGLDSQASRHGMRHDEANRHNEVSNIAGRVARDLINPLSAIFGYIELLKSEPASVRAAQMLGKMEEQIEKARRALAAFSTGAEIGQPRRTEPAQASTASTAISVTSNTAAPEIVVPPAAQWQAPAPPRSAHVLLVQRNEAVVEFQRSVLSALGVQVTSAATSDEALQALRSREIDAVILDDELEDAFSSKRLVCWVRENRPELSDKMLMTVSRKPTAETREILEVGMLPHVTKPLEVMELFSRAQQVLQNGRGPFLLQ